jgi:hypothetical protein
VAMCSLAALVLASCAATTTVTKPHVTGLPAISISVPLSNVACTTNNSCVALGTSNLDVSPTSVGEYRTASGRWTDLVVPTAGASTFIQSSSCWNSGCLFGGTQASGGLVWLYDASSHTITPVTAPTGASGIAAISCYASMTCAVVESTTSGPEFLITTDGGVSWSTPDHFDFPPHGAVSALSCQADFECIASFLSASKGVEVFVSSDGGTLWSERPPTPDTWSVLTSLNCSGRKCVGLAKQFTGWRIVRTDNFGKSWSKVASLVGAISSLACTSLDRCVVAGMTNVQSSVPMLATVTSGVVRIAKLKYVPSPISEVACGSSICAAIGVTTVMTLHP